MYANLKAEMSRYGVTSQNIADVIGTQVQAAILKINGNSEFKFSEAIKIRDTYFPNIRLEYLFTKVDNAA